MRKLNALLLAVMFLVVSASVSYAQTAGDSGVNYVHNDYTVLGLGGLDMVGISPVTGTVGALGGGVLGALGGGIVGVTVGGTKGFLDGGRHQYRVKSRALGAFRMALKEGRRDGQRVSVRWLHAVTAGFLALGPSPRMKRKARNNGRISTTIKGLVKGGVGGALAGGTAGAALGGFLGVAAPVGFGLGNTADEFIQAGLTRGDNAPAKPVVSSVSDFM